MIAKKIAISHDWLWKNVVERARTRAFSSLAKILTFWSILALRLFFSDVITHKRSIDAFARPLQSSRKLLQAQPIVFNNFNQVQSWLKKLIKQTNQKRSPLFNRRKVLYQPNETKTVLTNRTRLKSHLLKRVVAICTGVNFQRSGWNHTTCLKIGNTANWWVSAIVIQ